MENTFTATPAHPFLYFTEDCTSILVKVSNNFGVTLKELNWVFLSCTVQNTAEISKLLLKTCFPDDLPNGTLCCHYKIALSKPAWRSQNNFPKYRVETVTNTQPSYSVAFGRSVPKARQGFTVRALKLSWQYLGFLFVGVTWATIIDY